MKGAKTIADKQAYEFIRDNINGNCLYTPNMIQDYCSSYFEWIQKSKLNKLHNLNKFKSKKFVHGSSQSFDFFYLTNHKKRFRIFKGDFMYHQIMFRNGYNWKYIDDRVDSEIKKNDAVIFSLPFSDLGDIHPRTNEILDKCDELGVPVFLDCAYMVMARDIEFDFDRKCIQGISFSLSKGFYGAEHLRIGLRLTREDIDDPVDVFNSFEMVSYISCDIGIKLFNNFETDYLQNMYRKKQIQVCNDLFLEPSKCVIFGITDETHLRFGDYDRGTQWRRVCISNLIGNMESLK